MVVLVDLRVDGTQVRRHFGETDWTEDFVAGVGLQKAVDGLQLGPQVECDQIEVNQLPENDRVDDVDHHEPAQRVGHHIQDYLQECRVRVEGEQVDEDDGEAQSEGHVFADREQDPGPPEQRHHHLLVGQTDGRGTNQSGHHREEPKIRGLEFLDEDVQVENMRV